MSASPAFQRARVYQSWDDVARLEERVSQALRRIPLTSTVLETAPCSVAAGDAVVYALVDGSGVVTVSAARAGQLVEVKSRGGTLTVQDAGGALIDGAATQSVGAYVALLLVWSGQDWSIV